MSWLGYVGFLTAHNTIDNYIISINYRRTQTISLTSFVKNFGRTIKTKWPIGYLVRTIIENKLDISRAKSLLEKAELILPCNITIYAPKYQTYIFTRDCDVNKIGPNILWLRERKEYVEEIQKKRRNV